VNVIEVSAVPHDLYEFRKRVTSLWPPRVIRRQVARVEMLDATGTAWEGTEVLAPCEVVCWSTVVFPAKGGESRNGFPVGVYSTAGLRV
jgi:hypothetical protein